MAKDKKEDRSVEKEFKFSSASYRLEGETYEEYKARRKLIKTIEKQKLKGKHVWPSKLMGTYYKEFKGHEENMVNQTIKYIEAAQQQSEDTPPGETED